MYDAVNVTAIPRDAEAVAGYVNGRWPTYWALVTEFPQAKKLSIAVDAFHDADCLDVERFDASPDQAPAWVKKQIARGVKRPVVYCSVAEAATVLRYLGLHGVKRDQIRLWTAHYTGRAHRCSPVCRFGLWTVADATQFSSTSVDTSLVSATFFGPVLTRAQLRARILRWHRNGVSWARIKATKVWARFRALGGK